VVLDLIVIFSLVSNKGVKSEAPTKNRSCSLVPADPCVAHLGVCNGRTSKKCGTMTSSWKTGNPVPVPVRTWTAEVLNSRFRG
jgi:hypothetical protein